MSLDLYRRANNQPVSLAFPILVAAIPLLDSGLAVLRRLQRHVPVASGDRHHLYDVLLAR